MVGTSASRCCASRHGRTIRSAASGGAPFCIPRFWSENVARFLAYGRTPPDASRCHLISQEFVLFILSNQKQGTEHVGIITAFVLAVPRNCVAPACVGSRYIVWTLFSRSGHGPKLGPKTLFQMLPRCADLLSLVKAFGGQRVDKWRMRVARLSQTVGSCTLGGRPPDYFSSRVASITIQRW